MCGACSSWQREQFLPLYLRFIKGVIDSGDLPRTFSRELLQQDEQVEAMRNDAHPPGS